MPGPASRRPAATTWATLLGVPVEPPPGPWDFPTPTGDDDLVGVGADLAPGTILAAYRAGLFPMPLGEPSGRSVLGWWSPVRRGVLPLDGLRVTRSLARSCRRFEIRVDTAFAEVVDACADRRRPHGWISAEVRAAYVELHRLGWAHSVEAWTPDGALVGGLYGVAVAGLFAGESMFHHERDASKSALVALVDMLAAGGEDGAGDDGAGDDGAGAGAGRLLDVQWHTPHLASLGAVEITRPEYLARLATALRLPLPPAFRAFE